jgi:hypothetical protein
MFQRNVFTPYIEQFNDSTFNTTRKTSDVNGRKRNNRVERAITNVIVILIR